MQDWFLNEHHAMQGSCGGWITGINDSMSWKLQRRAQCRERERGEHSMCEQYLRTNAATLQRPRVQGTHTSSRRAVPTRRRPSNPAYKWGPFQRPTNRRFGVLYCNRHCFWARHALSLSLLHNGERLPPHAPSTATASSVLAWVTIVLLYF